MNHTVSHNRYVLIASLAAALAFAPLVGEAQVDDSTAPHAEEQLGAEEQIQEERVRQEGLRAEQQAAIAEAEKSLDEAQKALEAVHAALAETATEESEEVQEMQRELSQVHRELQEASRQVARAHRELALTDRRVERIRVVNLGDRAVIGVVMGDETDEGVEIRGVSPNGPAERAGIRQGDVLTSINGVGLAGGSESEARDAVFEAMSEAKAGDELAVSVLRDGDVLDFTVTVESREPASWQSVIRLPQPIPGPIPGVPGAPPAPHMIVNRMVLPDIDEEALAERIELIAQQAQDFEYRFIGDDGETVEFVRHLEFDGDPMTGFDASAFNEANFWFGFPLTRGLELASINAELGEYFKAERGVLVIRANADNAYGLESGDVIQAIDSSETNSPGDLLRALREAEPGAEVEFHIKRDRRDRTLSAKVPENRLGMVPIPR